MEQSLSERARQGVLRVVGDDGVKALGTLFPRHRGFYISATVFAKIDGAGLSGSRFFARMPLSVSRHASSHCGVAQRRAMAVF